MNRLGKHSLFLSILLLVSALCFLAGADLNTEQVVTCLCNAPSSLPDEEVVVSLPDGFFSLYESKGGYVYAPESTALPDEVDQAFLYKEQHDALGTVVIALDEMSRNSPYVYETEGRVNVSLRGSDQTLALDKVDYACDASGNNLCYRLSCSPESGCDTSIAKVYMLCYSCTDDQSVLVGSISYLSDDGVMKESYPFFITGRDSFESERHLQKKITVATK